MMYRYAPLLFLLLLPAPLFAGGFPPGAAAGEAPAASGIEAFPAGDAGAAGVTPAEALSLGGLVTPAEGAAAVLPSGPVCRDGVSVGRVAIKGFRVLSEKKARAVLIDQQASWKPWAEKPAFAAENVEADKETLRRFLEGEGFFEGRVEAEVRFRKKGRVADVTFLVSEGEPALITRVTLEGMEGLPAPLVAGVEARMTLVPGARFRGEDYRAVKKAFARFLGDNGYPRAAVTGSVLVDRARRTARVTFSVDPGPRYRFGDVAIAGLDRSAPALIRSRLDFSAGDLYSETRVEESRHRLFELGIFSGVSVAPDPERPPAGDTLPMRVSGVYRPPHELKLGLGYGTEDKLRGQVTWKHRNLGLLAQRLELSVKASFLEQTAEATYYWPLFLRPDQELSDSLGASRQLEASYINRSLYNKALLTRRIGSFWHFRLGHTLELDRPEDLPVELDTEDFREEHNYFVSTVGVSVDRDTRKPLLDPVGGSYASAGLSYASAAFGSSVQFMRLDLSASRITPLSSSTRLACRILFSTLTPMEGSDTIPYVKRLFSGGSTSVRGYPYQELGPLDANGKPVGGQTLWEASVELRFPVYRALSGVVFSDAGAVLADSFAFDPGEVRYTAGAGLRYHTVVGPIRGDFGYQLNPETRSQPTYQFYFSIGQAF